MPARQSWTAGRRLVDSAYFGLGVTQAEDVQPDGRDWTVDARLGNGVRRRRVHCAPRRRRARQNAVPNLTHALLRRLLDDPLHRELTAQAPQVPRERYPDAVARPPIELLLTAPTEHGDLQSDVPVTTVARLLLAGPCQGNRIIAAADCVGAHGRGRPTPSGHTSRRLSATGPDRLATVPPRPRCHGPGRWPGPGWRAGRRGSRRRDRTARCRHRRRATPAAARAPCPRCRSEWSPAPSRR
ncbi:hypothetical protein QF037_008886 [Streptomyces canus]|nr:hypothetical protein [Streptomyces canus]